MDNFQKLQEAKGFVRTKVARQMFYVRGEERRREESATNPKSREHAKRQVAASYFRICGFKLLNLESTLSTSLVTSKKFPILCNKKR